MHRLFFSFCLVGFILLFSCGEKKECPGFSDNLDAYIPREERMVFHNVGGDSLVFNTAYYERIGPHTEEQNTLSVGGSGSKPYCRSSCSLRSVYSTTDPQQLNYTITIDNEALMCTLAVNLTSNLPTIDYFLSDTTYSSEGRLFGDTLKLGNSSTTTAPRFSHIEIVHGRGIVRIQDDRKRCLWFR